MQIGLILYFPEYDDDKIYVNKNWVISNIYNILLDLKEKNGEFDRKYIIDKTNILDNERTIDSLIQLMKNFKIIFQNPFNHNFIAPLYLPSRPDKGVNLFLLEKRIPNRRIEYTGFIHKRIVLDFYQEYGRLAISDESKKYFYYWKDGLIIKDNESQQIILVEFNIGDENGNAFIDVTILNDKYDINNFLTSIIDFIKKINKDYGIEDDEIDELVTLDGEDFVSLELLNKNAIERKLIFYERRKNNYYNFEDFINVKPIKLIDYNKFLTNQLNMHNIFISYSKEDIELVNSFIRSLKPLQLQGTIGNIWYCSYLSPGDEVHEKIKAQMIEADIVIFMCSNFFFSTSYIIHNELMPTLKRKNEGGKQIILPIIIDRCKWILDKDDLNLGKYAGFPYRGKPVSDFDNWNDAWYVTNWFLEKIIKIKDQPTKDYEFELDNDIRELLERQVKGELNK